jgi:hypothetical protein
LERVLAVAEYRRMLSRSPPYVVIKRSGVEESYHVVCLVIDARSMLLG